MQRALVLNHPRLCPARAQPQRVWKRGGVLKAQASPFHTDTSAPGDDLDPSNPATVEMLVAHDIHDAPPTDPASAAHPPRRTVPAPRRAAQLLAQKLALAKQQNAALASGSGGSEVLDAQQRAQSLVVAQSNVTKALRAELSMTQTQLKEQSVELRATREALAQRDSEVHELRATLADRNAQLGSAREELVEAELALAEKDEQLLQAYESLSTACRERAALRAQLVRTHTELASTRTELESLAQDILDLKMVMDTIGGDDEEEEEDGSEAVGASASGPAPPNGTPILPFWPLNGSTPAEGSPAKAAAGKAGTRLTLSSSGSGLSGLNGSRAEREAKRERDEAAAEEATLSALSSLVALTQQMALDAQQDEAVYSQVSQLLERRGGEEEDQWDGGHSGTESGSEWEEEEEEQGRGSYGPRLGGGSGYSSSGDDTTFFRFRGSKE